MFLPLHTEPVAVGIVVKNPLAIPLLMTKFTLVWQFTSGHTPSSTPLLSPKSPLSPSLSSSSTAAGTTCNNARGFPFSEEKPAASCQVIEQIELHPNEQRMVLRTCVHVHVHVGGVNYRYIVHVHVELGMTLLHSHNKKFSTCTCIVDLLYIYMYMYIMTKGGYKY